MRSASPSISGNQVERWFATLSETYIRRGTHRSTRQLEQAIRQYIQINNTDPRPFNWTKSADDILASVKRFCLRISAWLSFSSSPKSPKAARDLAELTSPWAQKLTRDRHVNIVAGRATLADRTPRLYAYVHKLVPSAPARLDQFLFASGVAPDERVTVISDDAGEFGKAVDGSQLARGRILDWFHIAMKFKAAKNSVLGSQPIEPHERIAVETEIDHAKWLVWHGKGRQSVSRIKALDATLLAKEGYEHSTLYWNLRRLYFYIGNNAGTLVNYGMRYHKGLPISSSIAESAVNQVVSHCMAKKQQMRWTDEGAHCLAQVRVAVLNEEFSVEKLAGLTKPSAAANSPSACRAARIDVPRFGSLSERTSLTASRRSVLARSPGFLGISDGAHTMQSNPFCTS